MQLKTETSSCNYERHHLLISVCLIALLLLWTSGLAIIGRFQKPIELTSYLEL